MFCFFVLLHYLTIFFFFNDTATTEIYTLSLHDALPIWMTGMCWARAVRTSILSGFTAEEITTTSAPRSEEHTSELQSRQYLVCRLLLEKKKKKKTKQKQLKTNLQEVT